MRVCDATYGAYPKFSSKNCTVGQKKCPRKTRRGKSKEILGFYWTSDNWSGGGPNHEYACDDLDLLGQEIPSPTRSHRRETKEISSVHSLVPEVSGGRKASRSKESSKAEFSASEIDLKYESDSIVSYESYESYESFRIPPIVLGDRSTQHSRSEYAERTKHIAEIWPQVDGILHVGSFLKTSPNDTPAHHGLPISESLTDIEKCVEANTAPNDVPDSPSVPIPNGLAVIEGCLEIIATMDARANLENIHSLLDEFDTRIPQQKPSYGSAVSSQESSAIVSPLVGFKFSAHRDLLGDAGDESGSNRSTSSDTRKLSDLRSLDCSTSSGESGSDLQEPNPSMSSSMRKLSYTSVLSCSIGSSDSGIGFLNHSATSTQLRMDIISTTSQTLGFKLSHHGDMLEHMLDETGPDRSPCSSKRKLSDAPSLDCSTASGDSGGGVDLQDPNVSRWSSDSDEHQDTVPESHSSALNDLLEQLNITHVDKVASLPQKGVRALVHVFEARGLMPDLPTRSIVHVGSMNRMKTPEPPYKIKLGTCPDSNLGFGDYAGGSSSFMSAYDTDESADFGTPLKRYPCPVFEGVVHDDQGRTR